METVKLTEQQFKEWLIGMIAMNFLGGFENIEPEWIKIHGPKLKKTAEEIIAFAKEHKVFEP